jgi:hypothetical protein
MRKSTYDDLVDPVTGNLKDAVERPDLETAIEAVHGETVTVYKTTGRSGPGVRTHVILIDDDIYLVQKIRNFEQYESEVHYDGSVETYANHNDAENRAIELVQDKEE